MTAWGQVLMPVPVFCLAEHIYILNVYDAQHINIFRYDRE